MCGVLYILAGLGVGVYCLWAGIRGLTRGVFLVLASGGGLFRKLRLPETLTTTKE